MTEADSNTPRKVFDYVEEALERPPEERQAFLEQTCPKPLLSEAKRLLSAAAEVTDGADASFQVEVAASPAPLLGRNLGPYRLTELLGEGGMGQVYVGHRDDGAFQQTVAVKVIRASQFGGSAVERFERERQMLADLTHPNIAALYDGGTTEDGLPFVVMELIKGVSLDAYLQEHNLGLTERLRLFLQVCAAVEHAHRALIIHRDIKPSNILVTPDGLPKLLDFGIAKSLHPAEVGSHTVEPILTPAYASPEQVRGLPLTTAADVYSLGVLLYECLTGVLPYDTKNLSFSQLERLVTETVPEPPSTRVKEPIPVLPGELRGDLDAIVLQALAKEPERRYLSVAAFAEDIRRYLDGFPVRARRDSFAYRAKKFVRRHRLPVLSAVAVSVAVAVAFAITLQQYQRAERERARAQARFNQARQLAKKVLFEVYDKMAMVQGNLAARKALAEVGVEYLDQLAKDESAPDDILLDLGQQYNRLSRVYGGIGISSLGEPELSYELLLKSESALKKLLDRKPDHQEALAEMVWLKRLLATHVRIYQMDTKAAEAQAREGLAWARQGEKPRNWKLESRKWNMRADLIIILLFDRRFDEAVDLLKGYLEELQDPEVVQNLRAHDTKQAYFLALRGEAYADSGQTDRAIPDYEAALVFYQGKIEKEPEHTGYLTQAMRFNYNLGEMHGRRKEWDKAVRYGRRATQIANSLLELDPSDFIGRRNWAVMHQGFGKALAGAGEAEEAKSAILAAVKTHRELGKTHPEDTSLERDLAQALIDAGEVFEKVSGREEACRYFRESKKIWDKLEKTTKVLAYDRVTGIDRLNQHLSRPCPE